MNALELKYVVKCVLSCCVTWFCIPFLLKLKKIWFKHCVTNLISIIWIIGKWTTDYLELVVSQKTYSNNRCVCLTSTQDFPTYIERIVNNNMGECYTEKSGINPLLYYEFKDKIIREVHKSIEACAEKRDTLVGGQDWLYTTPASINKQGLYKSSADTCCSVDNIPLRTPTEIDSLTPDMLHLFGVILKHLNKETLILLRSVVDHWGCINKFCNVKLIME